MGTRFYEGNTRTAESASGDGSGGSARLNALGGEGRRLLAEGGDAVRRALSTNSLSFLEEARQDGGQ